MTTTYTLADVGCYVDGARGIYAIDRIVEIAEEHGMDVARCGDTDCKHCAGGDDDDSDDSWSTCEWAGDIEDYIDDYMNESYPVDGAYWGRSEAGDWGLWDYDNEIP